MEMEEIDYLRIHIAYIADQVNIAIFVGRCLSITAGLSALSYFTVPQLRSLLAADVVLGLSLLALGFFAVADETRKQHADAIRKLRRAYLLN